MINHKVSPASKYRVEIFRDQSNADLNDGTRCEDNEMKSFHTDDAKKVSVHHESSFTHKIQPKIMHESKWVCEPDGSLQINVKPGGYPPKTIMQLFQETLNAHRDRPALLTKRLHKVPIQIPSNITIFDINFA